MRKFKIAATALALAMTSTLALSQMGHAKQKEFPACSARPTVAVDTFRTEHIEMGWGEEFAINARDVAVTELTNSGCFRVVERGGSGVSAGFEREKGLEARGDTRKGQKRVKGNVTIADRLVQFALTGASSGNVGGSFGGGGFGGGKFGAGAVAPKSSAFQMNCRIYDSRSTEVLAAASVKKSKVDVSAAGLGGGKLGFGGDFFYKTPLGKTITALIHDCAVELASRTQNMTELN